MAHTGFYGVFRGKALQCVESSPDMAVFAIRNLAPNGDKWTEETPGDWHYAPVIVCDVAAFAALSADDISTHIVSAAANVANFAAAQVEATGGENDEAKRYCHAAAAVFDAVVEGAQGQ